MAKTKMLCLCATYGRPRLLANSLALFLNQDYKDKFLLIFDDFGQYANIKTDNYAVVSTTKRSENMPDKYRRMLDHVELGDYLGICVWDDDDVYMPNHISLHAEQLRNFYWSRPEYVYTICPELSLEFVKGNHWASYAFDPGIFAEYLPNTDKAYWDSLLISNVAKDHRPGIIREPSFIFRWQTTKHPHLQYFINDPHDTTSYGQFPCADKTFVDPLIPMLDNETRNLLVSDLSAVGFK